MFRLFLCLCVMIGANVPAIPLCVMMIGANVQTIPLCVMMIGANVQTIPLSVCDDRTWRNDD